MIQVLIADDHQIVLDGLSSILKRVEDINVLATAINSAEVLKILADDQVDVVIMDIEIPETNGIELTKEIKVNYPEVKVIMLTMYKTAQFVNRAIEAGAMGYLLKERGQEELVTAIRKVHRGETFLGEQVLELLVKGIRSPQAPNMSSHTMNTTKREKEVLALVLEGLTVKEIAERLYIAPTTVISHKESLFAKAGVKNVKELIAFAYKQGLV